MKKSRGVAGDDSRVTIVGGGLAGCEAAYQLLRAGLSVCLIEQRPAHSTPAHTGHALAELVCSNSLRSDRITAAPGLLKEEMRQLGSLIVSAADSTRVPAGQALAVDREMFSSRVQAGLESFPNFRLERRRLDAVPRSGPTIVATGPLTAEPLASDLATLLGAEYLHFYDAIAPIVYADSIDRESAFRASRYGKGEDDYLNCPLDRGQYLELLAALRGAEQYPLHDFEADEKSRVFFEGCLPAEELARRGDDALRFGPLKPVGLPDPSTGKLAYAVVQLRQDDLAAEHYNIVGFQTRMRQSEQERVLRLIPALRSARFARFGGMHRNSFVRAPAVLDADWRVRGYEELYIAGQLSGVEGYVESAASGLAAGLHLAQRIRGGRAQLFPPITAIGALGHYISGADPDHFQPTNITFGLIDSAGIAAGPRRSRREAVARRALEFVRRRAKGLAPPIGIF